MEHEKAASRDAGRFAAGTFLSRVTGFAREVFMASCFGTSAEFAAFLVAFRFSQLLRRLLGESALGSSFVPYFEELRSRDPREAALYFRDTFCSLSLLLVALVLVAELLLWWVESVCHLGPVLSLTLWMLPGLVFVCLYALFGGLLQCERRFFLPAVAPLMFNLIWIATTFLSAHRPAEEGVRFLAVGVVVAYLLQWLILLPSAIRFLSRQGVTLCSGPIKLFSGDVRRLSGPMFYSVVGIGAVQINSAIDLMLARIASQEGPAYLGYAVRLYQFPIALFAVGVASVLLPILSRRFEKEPDQFCNLLAFGLRRALLLLLPCAGGLFVVGYAFVSLSYLRGQFSEWSALHTTHALWCYTVGLAPHALVTLLASALYAMKEFRLSMWGSLLAVGTNLLFSSFLLFGLHAPVYSVALATSAASCCQALFLLAVLRRKGFLPPVHSWLLPSLKLLLVVAISASVTLLVGHLYLGDPSLGLLKGVPGPASPGWSSQLTLFFSESLLFGSLLLLLGPLFGLKELTQMTREILSRITQKFKPSNS